MSQRLLRIIIVSLFTVVLLGMIGLFMLGQESVKRGALQPVGGDVGGPYRLIDQDNESVTDKSFEDSYTLIYFGFTYCPAICPTELSKMIAALDQMGTSARAVQPLFITIDPDRDTAPVMKKYVPMFSPRLIGLTGSAEQIKTAADAFKVYYAKVKPEGANDYTMDHSSYIYFMSPEGELLHIFKTDDTADVMAQTMQAWLDQRAAE